MKSGRMIRGLLAFAFVSGAFTQALALSLVSDNSVKPNSKIDNHAVLKIVSPAIESFANNVMTEDLVTSLAYPKALTTLIDQEKATTQSPVPERAPARL